MLRFSVTFFLTIANFAILYFVLDRVLFRRVRDFAAARAEKVRSSMAGAEATKRGADELKLRYDDLLANAEDEAAWVLRDAEDRAAERSREIVAEAEAAGAEVLKRAEKRSELERARARDELAAEIATIATLAASAAALRNLDGESERRAALEFVRALEADGEDMRRTSSRA